MLQGEFVRLWYPYPSYWCYGLYRSAHTGRQAAVYARLSNYGALSRALAEEFKSLGCRRILAKRKPMLERDLLLQFTERHWPCGGRLLNFEE